MHSLALALQNLLSLPILCFLAGALFGLTRKTPLSRPWISTLLTLTLLFVMGLKGGASLALQGAFSGAFLIILLTFLALGFLQPFLSFFLLKRLTRIDPKTAAAIAACFGSISVMTFVAATTFLEHLQVGYKGFVLTLLALMEVPAIISGLLLGKKGEKVSWRSWGSLVAGSIFNKAILAILAGMLVGWAPGIVALKTGALSTFSPLLCLFLADMGMRVGTYRHHLRAFSWQLILFGMYMPLLGGLLGLCASYLLGLDPGTGTLLMVLMASASYIAAPAALRTALPQAQETIYLPLSLGITFPFNVLVGIPLYYHLAVHVL